MLFASWVGVHDGCDGGGDDEALQVGTERAEGSNTKVAEKRQIKERKDT